MNTSAPVLVHKQGDILTLTINRPERRNAIDTDVAQALGDGLERGESDTSVRAVVITGAGSTFSAGADLRAVAAGRTTLPSRNPEWGFAGVVRHRTTKPLIAALNGDALGGGGEILLACDLAISAESAVIGFPEVTHGLVAAGGALFRLNQQIPRKVAVELLLSGRPITAHRAHAVGLLNAVVADGDALHEALKLAQIIARHEPQAVVASKAAVHRFALSPEWDDDTWAENDALKADIFQSATARRAAARFHTSRVPH